MKDAERKNMDLLEVSDEKEDEWGHTGRGTDGGTGDSPRPSVLPNGTGITGGVALSECRTTTRTTCDCESGPDQWENLANLGVHTDVQSVINDFSSNGQILPLQASADVASGGPCNSGEQAVIPKYRTRAAHELPGLNRWGRNEREEAGIACAGWNPYGNIRGGQIPLIENPLRCRCPCACERIIGMPRYASICGECWTLYCGFCGDHGISSNPLCCFCHDDAHACGTMNWQGNAHGAGLYEHLNGHGIGGSNYPQIQSHAIPCVPLHGSVGGTPCLEGEQYSRARGLGALWGESRATYCPRASGRSGNRETSECKDILSSPLSYSIYQWLPGPKRLLNEQYLSYGKEGDGPQVLKRLLDTCSNVWCSGLTALAVYLVHTLVNWQPIYKFMVVLVLWMLLERYSAPDPDCEVDRTSKGAMARGKVVTKRSKCTCHQNSFFWGSIVTLTLGVLLLILVVNCADSPSISRD